MVINKFDRAISAHDLYRGCKVEFSVVMKMIINTLSKAKQSKAKQIIYMTLPMEINLTKTTSIRVASA